MPTNDGYSPYPAGLNATEFVAALKRAHNFDDELKNYNKLLTSSEEPTIIDVVSGDLWYNTNNQKIYRAHIDNTILLWFEV